MHACAWPNCFSRGVQYSTVIRVLPSSCKSATWSRKKNIYICQWKVCQVYKKTSETFDRAHDQIIDGVVRVTVRLRAQHNNKRNTKNDICKTNIQNTASTWIVTITKSLDSVVGVTVSLRVQHENSNGLNINQQGLLRFKQRQENWITVFTAWLLDLPVTICDADTDTAVCVHFRFLFRNDLHLYFLGRSV